MEEAVIGIVDWFGSKGVAWGSINYGDGLRCFVHYKNIIPSELTGERYRTLEKGQRVSFKIGPGHFNDGTQALEVKVIVE